MSITVQPIIIDAPISIGPAGPKGDQGDIGPAGPTYVLPAPGPTTLGGVKRNAGGAGEYVVGIDVDGSLLHGTPAGGGTVTSVAVSGSDGIEVDSGSPITSSGTIALGVNATALRTHLNVENGATADQTATEIRDALLTVDGAASGVDADLLDGQHASAFATSGHTHAQLHDAATVTGNGIAIAGQVINLSVGTGATDVAAGNDGRFVDERVPTAAGLTSKFGTAKVTIADGDKVPILDSAALDAPKHSLFSLVKSTLKTYFDTLYNLYTHPNHTGAVTSTGDGATALGLFTLSALNTAISDATVATGGGTATGTNTGDNALNSLYSGLVTNANHSGDATGDTVLTLATVNAGVGEFGSVTQSPILTVNAKGLVTAASEATITPAVGSITGLGTGVATALAINVGTSGAPVVLGGAAGTPSSLTLTNATGLGTAGLLDDAVTLAKLAAGTAGNLITYDVSGNPAAVATGTATHVLTSNGAGVPPTFQVAAGGNGHSIPLYASFWT